MWHDAGMPARYRSERFIGREREISRLAVALDAAADGRTGRLLLTGPGGIGVSRLIDEAARRVERLSHPFSVIRCRATAGRAAVPYAPIAEGLRHFLSELEDAELRRVLGPAIEPLGRLVPELSARFDAPPRPRRLTIAPERRAAWINEAIRGLLERAGERHPVLLVLEDLHHADGGTRGLATFLARVARPARLCIVMTFGGDALPRGHPFIADLAAIAGTPDPSDRLSLGPLDRHELVQLIADIEGERPTAATVLLVADRSSGNPLLAEEILAARRELSGVSLGASLEELVAARLARRSPECRRLLRLLAPAWQPLSEEEVMSAVGAFERLAVSLPPRSSTRPRRAGSDLEPDLQAGLEEALEHGLAIQLPNGRLEVRHELIASAIENDLLPNLRRRHHEAIAEALGGKPAEAFPHWRAANRPAAARDAAIAAAAVADDLDSPVDGLAARETALELGAADGDDRAEIGQFLIRTGEVALAAGRPNRALAYLESAASRFGERADRAAVASLHEALGRVARTLGDHERAVVEHRRAAATVPPGPSSLRARVLASLAQTLMLQGHFAEAARTAEAAIDVARLVGPDALAIEGHATCTLGIARAWSADPADAIGLLEAAREIARSTGHADEAFRATLNLATGLTLLGRRDDAIEVTRQAIEEARRDGLEVAYGNALRGNIAEGLFLVGRWDEARDTIRTALEWSPAPEAFADASVTAAILEVESGVDERAASLLGWRPLRLARAPDPQLEVPATRAAASFALWRGDVDDARRAAELGWSLVRRAEDWALTARMASTYLEVQAAIVADAHERRALPEISGARQRARRVLAETEAVLRASGVPPEAASRREAEANLATVRAYAARIESREDPALWDHAAQAWERVGEPYQVARARWRHAEALLPARDAREGRAAARGPLLEAVSIARKLRARPLLRALESLARRSMIVLPPEPDGSGAASPDGPPAEAGSDAPVSVGVKASGRRSSGLREALVGGTENGARSVAGPVAVAIVASGEAPRPEAAFGISPREREVLGLIVQGRTNREIGEHLFISQKTVGVHVGNILAKLGVSGRVEAAMVAVRLDLVPTPGA